MSSIREFIVTTTEHFYGISDTKLDEKGETSLFDFVHNPQILLLQSSANGIILLLSTHIKNDSKKSLIFYKTSAISLSEENYVNNINIITMTSNAAESLYQVLRHIYSPMLTLGDDLYTSKLQKNLLDLETNLRVLTHGKSNGNVNVILSIEDEIDYWKTIAHEIDSTKIEKEAASSFSVIFEEVCEEIRSMQSNPLQELRYIAENIGGLLDDVWRYTAVPYPQDRMIHVLDILGHVICSTIQKAINSIDLWKIFNGLKDNEILSSLNESLNLIQTWVSACASLTETYWPNYAVHPWNGTPYVPQFCLNFQQRLQEIHDVRSIHNQLNKLLTNAERIELNTNQLFDSFTNINVWICSGPNLPWKNAVSQFSINLRPSEMRIAEKLKPRMHNTSTKQILYEFIRYKALLNRPIVKHALNNELEIFVSSLLSLLKTIQTQLSSDEIDVKMYQPPEMSPLVQQIQWAKQMEATVKDIHICTENYLKEFQGSIEVSKLASQVLNDIKTLYTQLHEEWSRDLQAQVKNGSLQLRSERPVVEFDARSRLMVVNFSPRLVSCELEARALTALGLPPTTADASALHALVGALQHARALQQVASFHNTLGERMIPSTRPMMLQTALNLSVLVQDQKAVYWHDVDQLTNYTDKLKTMVLKLGAQNSYLTCQHMAIRNVVEKLMDTELLAKQSEWKKGIKEIRDIIEKVEANGYKNTEQWRSHWDWQLYKALELQYIKTLLILHTYFPHVRVDLVLRGRMVRLQPPIEEIRVQHYHQLRRLVALPAHFVGFTKQNIFASIVQKHGWLGNKAVGQLERAMCSLEQTCHTWTQRLALACVPDLEALCTDQLTEPHHWELNFKACKAYGQTVAKMTFEDEKIHWISVGTATLRREFEAQARSLWVCLMSSLQNSCQTDSSLLDTFMANAIVMLEKKALPKNAKELAEISMTQQTLQNKMPEMEKIMENLKRKGHLLRTWGGDPSVDSTLREWQKVCEQMLSHQQMFEHQAELVKSSLNGEWANLNANVETWLSRWSQAESRLESTKDAHYDEMVERCSSVFEAQVQWEKFCAEREELEKECKKFNMDLKSSDDTWKEAEKLIKKYVEKWKVLKDFNEDYKSLVNQEWIVIQKKLHLIDELVIKWNGRLEPYTTITLFLKQELDKYDGLTTALKYLRGSDFTERHWREVFNVIEVDYKAPDTLRLKDLLCASKNIKKQIKALQKIIAQASSEAAVRSALNDLELWYASARLTIVYYTDKSKRPIPIVKDIKDILNKIEEKQWVISSVSGGRDVCGTWDARLRTGRQLLRAAHHAQRRWLYLEPILCNDDGELGLKFRKVDQGFKQVARILESDPRLSALLQSSRLQPTLDVISEQLSGCQSALNQYIDEKRSIFPRLYFLSDDDLLELLGQARAGAEGKEIVLQLHLKKLFPGITGVRLGPSGLSITALCSHYNEVFHLDHPVDIDYSVEVWLKNLETEIRASLKNLALKCILNNDLHDQDPFSMPTQILCLAQNIRFTEQAERAITSKELQKLKVNVEKENLFYAAAEVETESEKRKRQSLILQCTHYMYIVRTLIDNNVTSIDDWQWQKQLRFYLLNSIEIVAKMGLAQISYSYEYLGVNTGQFVRTELADECFLILTQSLYLGSMGNPFGPAGTGKTESVKALGGLLGRLVLVFNCDEAMDGECMGRLLTGLALSGAWGCFDEFNRLTADTLALVSHQLSSLLSAMQHKPASEAIAMLNGKQVLVSEWCGVAATMNPSGRGYGGRRALPAALERLLRPVAVVQPCARQLCAHLLAAHCCSHAELLASDLQTVFTMANTLLSGQRHYDWGLRALKAAVGSCGAALTNLGQASTDIQRAALRRVLRLNNLSKLTKHDVIRFENILSMVFADIPQEDSTVNPIHAFLENSVRDLGLMYNKDQIEKCVELYEQLQQRMGVAIVGPPGSGKTTIRRLLKTALSQQGKSVVEYVINPKAMSRKWLLGHVDHDTRQWTDGVISTVALEVTNQSADMSSWVVCDGDVEPRWVEALNSVLDDNRLLTLPSGGRLHFADNVNFVFETHSLAHASPATVSRLAIILLSDEYSCAPEVLECWMKNTQVENETAKASLPILQLAVNKIISWFHHHKSDVAVKYYEIAMVKQIITQFEYIISNNLESTTGLISPEEIVYMAIQRSIMGVIKENAIDSFYGEMSDFLGPPPTSNVISDSWVSESLYISSRLAEVEPILRACITAQRHVLLLGSNACAKHTLAEYVLKECNTTVITVDCTPILEPEDIIRELKKNNVIRSGASSGVEGAAVALVVRELHRAHVDEWGSCPVHAFLLQLVQQGGLWTQEEGGVQWNAAARTMLIGTAASASLVAPRLAALLAPIILRDPDDDELYELTRKTLSENVSKNISEQDISNLIDNILLMFKEVSESFSSRSHYKWNASHLKKWCENVKWYSPSTNVELITAIKAEADVIFCNRLITDDDKAKYNQIAMQYLKYKNVDGIYFRPKLRNDGIYVEAIDYNTWCQDTQKLINQCLSESDDNVLSGTGIEVCLELAILCPVIALVANGGVVTCIGSTGVGRRAATCLMAAALPAVLFHVDRPQNFVTFFKNAISSAAECARTYLLLEESITRSDTLACVEALRRARSLHAIPANIMPSLSNLQQTHHLLQNIKQNLGIVILLNKDQDNLSEVIDKYSFLYNEGPMVWLERWSEETLRLIPPLVIRRLMKENVTEVTKEDLDTVPTDGFVIIYKSIEVEWLRAPCRYINFIKSYYYIMNRKKTEMLQRKKTLLAGVEALRRARTEVATLQTEAAEQEVALSEKRAAANSALDLIGATVQANTHQKDEMHALKKNIELENEKLQIRKKEIEAELAAVEPVISAARAAVGDIRSDSLSEVRSLRAPPDVVRDVLEGVLRLMGIADTSWHSMKSFLSKRGVKEDIRCLDASQISSDAIECVRALLRRRGASFEAATARRASAACAPLAAWVHANLAYADALAKVQPLQAQQRQLHKNLQEAEAELTALSSGLHTVEERVAALKQQLGQHTRDAAALELSLEQATRTLNVSRDLLEQLAHEYTAWENDLQTISKEILEVNIRSLMSAAYLVYLPDLTEPQARSSVRKWGQLLDFDDESFSVVNFLSTPEKQLKWEADGLPVDKTAVKNALIIEQALEPSKCGFTPLVIDPDDDAVAWLKNALKDTQSEFVSQHNDKLHTAIQYAIRLNRILVVTEVESVEDWWSQCCHSGGSRTVLVSRDATLPARLPCTLAATFSPLYFTASLHGLTDQLIHYALQQQNPEINEKTREFKMKKATLQKQQYELQENLLRDLSTNGDILHDANLLASLKNTRSTADTIGEALKSANALEEETRAGYNAYEPIATRAASLVLAVKQLATQRPLVSLPVDTVQRVFVDALHKTGDIHNIDHDEVIKYLTRRIMERVLLSVHKRDKYIVVLYLLKQVYDKQIPEKLWNIFIGSFDAFEDPKYTDEIKKSYSWIHEDRVKKLAQLKVNDEALFNKLSLDKNEIWTDFQRSGDWNAISKLKLSPLETLVTVAVIRPENLYRTIVKFVEDMLGAGAVCSGEAVSCAARWSLGRPALLLAAHGIDVLTAHKTTLQVGIEEGRRAWENALEACRGGGWLAIVVGASPFTRDLQTFLTEFTQRSFDNYNNEFRLWVIAEDREIPPAIANCCVSVVLEAPEGVKHNVLGTLSAWGRYEADAALIRVHVCLALFHALAQERRAYVPQGWSRWYAWEWGDVRASAIAARAVGASDSGRRARALCEALYSARVAVAPDKALLSTLLQSCLHERSLGHAWRPAGVNDPLPYTPQLQNYVSAVDAWPDLDAPQLLGLSANCRLAWESNATNNIIAGLREFDKKISIKKTDSRAPLKTLLALWKKLMSGNPLIKADFHVDKKLRGWWGCVCEGEVYEVALAVRTVHAALAVLARASTHQPVALNTVPDEWQLMWAGPERPETYIKELSARARAALERLQTLHGDDYMPPEVDVRGFVRPERVVCALRALCAARLARPADRLALHIHWDRTEYDNGSRTYLLLRGLRLSGATWRGALHPAAKLDPGHVPAPPLLLTYIEKNKDVAPTFKNWLEIPVYTSESREEVIFYACAPLAPDFHREIAILNAVALFVAPID